MVLTVPFRLQEVVEIVLDYARRSGLTCAPHKSELLVFRPRLKNGLPEIKGFVEGTLIPQVERARIVGLCLQAYGRAGHTIS